MYNCAEATAPSLVAGPTGTSGSTLGAAAAWPVSKRWCSGVAGSVRTGSSLQDSRPVTSVEAHAGAGGSGGGASSEGRRRTEIGSRPIFSGDVLVTVTRTQRTVKCLFLDSVCFQVKCSTKLVNKRFVWAFMCEWWPVDCFQSMKKLFFFNEFTVARAAIWSFLRS